MFSFVFRFVAVPYFFSVATILMACENGGEGRSVVRVEESAVVADAQDEATGIDEGAQIEGITIINGNVSVDGVRVPRGTTKFRSAKTGRSYRIDWGKGDNVSVTEQ